MSYRTPPLVEHRAGRVVLRPWWRPWTWLPVLVVGLVVTVRILAIVSYATLRLHALPPPPSDPAVFVLLWSEPEGRDIASYVWESSGALGGGSHMEGRSRDSDRDVDNLLSLPREDELETTDDVRSQVSAFLKQPRDTDLTVRLGSRLRYLPHALGAVLMTAVTLFALRRRVVIDGERFQTGEVRAVIVDARMLGPLLLERPALLLRGGRKLSLGPALPGHARALADRARVAETLEVPEGEPQGATLRVR